MFCVFPRDGEHVETHGCAFLAVDLDFCKGRLHQKVKTILFQIGPSDGDCFHCLIDRAGTNGLDFCPPVLSYHTRNSTRNRCRAGMR